MLTVLTVAIGTEAHVFVDEALQLAQVELVGDGSWTTERPFAEADAEAVHSPMTAVQFVGSDRYAPYVAHPASVWASLAADSIGGRFGIRMLSVLGVTGAAVCSGLMAERLRRGTGPPTLWITGLLSPLVFDSQLMIAHGVAAGLVGAAALVASTSDRRTPLVSAGAMAVLVGGAALFRSEVVIFAAAGAVALTVAGLRAGRRSTVAAGVGTALGGALVFLVEPWWIGSLVDSSDISTKTIVASSRGGADGRVDAAFRVLVDPSYEGLVDASVDVALVAAVVLVLGAALLACRGRTELALVAAVAAVGFASFRLADPTVTPGLLLAFPLVSVAALLVVIRVHRLVPFERVALSAVGLFAVGVLLTQYSNGGGFEWGWRYVAVAVPVVAPTITLCLDDLRMRLPRASAMTLLGAMIVVSALLVASGLLEQRAIIDRTHALEQRLAAEAEGTDRLVFLDSLLGRSMWKLSLDGRVVTADDESAGDVLGWIDDAGEDDVLLVWSGAARVPVDTGAFIPGRVVNLGVSNLHAVRLTT